jgi:hypothetical protein
MSYSISDFRRDIRTPYAWPGGYARRFIMSDGEVMCHKCAGGRHRRDILQALSDPGWARSGFGVVGVDVLWEGDAEVCCGCNELLPTEYGPVDGDDIGEHDSNGQA